MIVVYDSKTNNVQRFVNKLGLPSFKIHEGLIIDEPYVLITYTTGIGKTPESVCEFLSKREEHGKHLKGVCGSGNMNWGGMFCAAADNISRDYGVKVLHKFEMSGLQSDVEKVREEVLNIAKMD
ncbi:class Ib ribonucleoside-diphosphate reductase assembly flavoprotein NrdI [Bacillus thuringiensis]|uniref:class Ib ribonucleoside-diphosphate reductase assembly flavoprotein NrdI n=1 Tax=Bacillus thuringiensis TaxID=1428 RepID=UPI000BF26AAF|nr:class Ib ribonucleoside-diphosphate reductase assembly flavoprotein NrdI [Bacillus thuringiensis]PFC28489.1 class Ib ribonucleoside-diphosphate reductase assembly flavoprotein NrdI [Bacillus thuringiensis]